jgi:hypothetical protein
MEAAIKVLQHNLLQKDEQIKATELRLQKLTQERGEINTTLKGLQNMTTVADQTSTPTNKVLKDEENWDLLGQPSGKFDYLVKYTAPESAEIPIEEVTPNGWKSNEEQEAESSGTTSDNKKSWAEEVEEEEEARKNGVFTIQQNVQNILIDPIDQQMGKYEAYVIFDGPFKGIYRS